MGGPAGAFQSTIWTDVLQAAGPESRSKLDRLLRTYWRPVYTFVRAAWGKSVEDAKDLTQAFFTHLLEKEVVARARPERGSFRAFLKQSLRNFLVDSERAQASRRPPGVLFHLDAAPGELERLGPVAPEENPDQAYDREWTHGLLESANESLRECLSREGKAKYFEVFRLYCIEQEDSTYDSVAERLGLRGSDVRHYLEYCRLVYRKLLRERIRDTVARDEDVDEEWKEILEG